MLAEQTEKDNMLELFMNYVNKCIVVVLILFSTVIFSENKGVQSMELTSTAFSHQQMIPSQYTCDGDNISPPLSWNNVPKNTRSLVLIVDDPDAPHGTWDHWILFNIPPHVTSLVKNVSVLPGGAKEGVNSWGKTGYGGPCPPSGVHRYIFALYALDNVLSFDDTPTKKRIIQAIDGHVIAQATLIATYER